MLLENFVLLHHQAIWIGIRAADATDPKHMEIYHTIVARLADKEQQLAMTISRYRASLTENVHSRTKNQKVASACSTNSPISGSNQGEMKGNVHGNSNPKSSVTQGEEPATGSCGNDQRTNEATVAA
jgi:hypothetical protein